LLIALDERVANPPQVDNLPHKVDANGFPENDISLQRL
jgi:hypothetical protein